MAVVKLNLSLEQVLDFIENLPKEYKKAVFELLKKEFYEEKQNDTDEKKQQE